MFVANGTYSCIWTLAVDRDLDSFSFDNVVWVTRVFGHINFLFEKFGEAHIAFQVERKNVQRAIYVRDPEQIL